MLASHYVFDKFKEENDQHNHIRYNCDMRTVNISDLRAEA